VKFLELDSRRTNLRSFAPTNTATLAMVDEAIKKRGIVVDIGSKSSGSAPFKLTSVAANASDVDLAELKDKIDRGELSVEAPCDGMHSEWSQEQKAKLDAVLMQVFQMK